MKVKPYGTLEVGAVSDDDCNRDGLPEHLCSCNCGEDCGNPVWRVGRSDDCAVCHTRRMGYEQPSALDFDHPEHPLRRAERSEVRRVQVDVKEGLVAQDVTQTGEFELACPMLDPHCEGRRFLVAAVVDAKGVVVDFDKLGGTPGFYCEECGSKAIAWKPGLTHSVLGNQVDLREALCARRGEAPWEKCPSCSGMGIQPIVFPCDGSPAPDEVPCPDCHGKGRIESGYRERKAAGEKLKAKRMQEGLSLREWCIKHNEDPVKRSRLERGFYVA